MRWIRKMKASIKTKIAEELIFLIKFAPVNYREIEVQGYRVSFIVSIDRTLDSSSISTDFDMIGLSSSVLRKRTLQRARGTNQEDAIEIYCSPGLCSCRGGRELTIESVQEQWILYHNIAHQ